MNRLVILGAGGHGKVVADIASRTGYADIAFLDDSPVLEKVLGFPVLGPIDLYTELDSTVFHVAMGNASTRKDIQEEVVSKGRRVVSLIHPNAVIADSARIGEGTVVMAGAVINPGAVIGDGCIINTCSSVDHDCVIGNFVHVAVGAHVAGAAMIGDSTWIGAGAIVSNDVSICPNCTIGAGAVVVRSIEVPGVYVGTPAQQIK